MSILLPEHVDQAVANTLENTAKPLSTNVGNTLGDLWFLVFGGISNKAEQRRIRYAVELEKFKEDLEQKCKNIPEEDLKEPDTQIAGQALEKSKFCVENEILRSMFSSLITSSMMKSKESIIHPSFSEIITQMSSDDANALLSFREAPHKPIQNFVIHLNGIKGYFHLFKNIWTPCYSIEELTQCQITIDSLSRLGLVNITYLEEIGDVEMYAELNNSRIYGVLNEFMQTNVAFPPEPDRQDFKINTQKGRVALTSFGMNFLNCVL